MATMPDERMNLDRRTEMKTQEVQVGDYKLRYGYVCQEGFYPDKPGYICQDQVTVLERFEDNPDQFFCGVFDGHGKIGCGEVVSQKTQKYLPNKILEMRASGRYQKFGPPSTPLPDVGTSAYERAFDSVSRQIMREMREKSNMAGSTAITVFMSGNAIHVANVGDSRAILGRVTPVQEGAAPSRADEVRVIELSKDQTPFRKDERQRILSNFPDVEIMTLGMRNGEVPVSEDYGDEEDLFGAAADPPRVWIARQFYPGSAFTRSIGDAIGKSAGVTAEPEILSRKLVPEDKYLIVCSDGVFEFLTNEEVIDMVHSHTDPYLAACDLVELSFNSWLENDDRTDDITAMVIKLEYTPVAQKDAERKAQAAANWQVARTTVAAHLENRPSRRFRSIVREAQKKYLHDKDFCVVDHVSSAELESATLSSGERITYD